MTTLEEKLRRDFNDALVALRTDSSSKSNNKKYGIAYKRLVLAGFEPKLRGKYTANIG